MNFNVYFKVIRHINGAQFNLYNNGKNITVQEFVRFILTLRISSSVRGLQIVFNLKFLMSA